MTSKSRLITLLLLTVLTLGSVRADDEQASKEARLRDALKAAYDQIRTLQDQAATLQAAQVESDKEKDALKTQAQALADQMKAEETKSTLALLAAHGQINDLKLQNALLQRRVDDDETRNVALFQLGNDILTRYEKFSLGDALAAKEPFTQLTRVKLENLVQGYEDKLIAQKVGMNSPTGALSTPDTAAK